MPVTPYAAGCAYCGADIEGARREKAQRRATVDRVLDAPGVPRLRLDDDVLRFVIALVVLVGVPPFGILLACFFAWQMHNEGSLGWRNATLGLAIAAVALPLFGLSIWGLASRL